MNRRVSGVGLNRRQWAAGVGGGQVIASVEVRVSSFELTMPEVMSGSAPLELEWFLKYSSCLLQN